MNNQILIFTLVIIFCSTSMVESRYVHNSHKVSILIELHYYLKKWYILVLKTSTYVCTSFQTMAVDSDQPNFVIYVQISSIKICKIYFLTMTSGWQPMKICTWKPASTQNHNYWAYVHFPFNGRNIYLRDGMHRLSRFHCHGQMILIHLKYFI